MLRLLDYIFVLRPLILIPAWSFYLLGASRALPESQHAVSRLPAPTVFVALTAILIMAYLLNQIFDRESDEKNGKCPHLARGLLGVRTITILAFVFFVIASLSFQEVGRAQRLPLLIALVLSLLYSLPPIRLCARPFVDLLANAFGYGGIAFILGCSLGGGDFAAGLLQSVPFVLLVGATFVQTALLDLYGDRLTDKNTTAVVLGVPSSQKLSAALHLLAIIAALLARDLPAIVVTAATLPINAFLLTQQNDRKLRSLFVQATTLVVTVVAIIRWPLYGAIVVPLVLLSIVYYKKRFGVNYPGVPRRPQPGIPDGPPVV